LRNDRENLLEAAALCNLAEYVRSCPTAGCHASDSRSAYADRNRSSCNENSADYRTDRDDAPEDGSTRLPGMIYNPIGKPP